MLGNIRIETGNDALPWHWHIYLDNIEISSYIRRIELIGDIGEVAQVKLFMVAKVDVPDIIQAHIVVEQDKEKE